ncbi:MlaD family protein [Cystobacter ferrugineus]|uniref:Mammalian cell entry protein n=1 Tax=Cystobacter ferrugineus TaxID=83449 RepID=A0A1L9ATW5_9BACT|nr:MlaD family protein [Cystobacter ferrugineus]OJH33450.1 mammalian cell entry protein [Cystobacter ferrugineus]
MSIFTQTSKDQRLALRVGAFVAMAFVLAGIVVFFIGQKTHLFEKQVSYRAYFASVEGLSSHSPVWLNGLEVGRVEAVGFPSKPGEKRMEVRLRLSTEYAQRVRADSVARLSSLGVLGDKAVDISLGSLDQPEVPEGGEIPSETTGDVSAMMRSASKVLDDAVAVSGELRKAVTAYADPQMAQDVAAGVRSLRLMLEEIEKGDGTLHALIYDKETGRNVRALVATASQTAVRMDKAVAHVESLLGEVEHGNGTAHALIYGQDGANALKELGSAAGQLAGLLEDAKKNPDGAVHQLVYGSSGGMIADLGSAAADIKQITSMIARGEGSLGGIITDPTVYEDLRQVVGNVKRNRVLRALVRFAIDNNDNVQYVGVPLKQPKDEGSQKAIGGGGPGSPPSVPSVPVVAPLPGKAP